MGTLRKLLTVIEELEDSGVDTKDVVIDPKAVHVVTPADLDEVDPEDED